MNKKERIFQKKILSFYRRQGRSFPWRNTQSPYRIVVSEIMLQQTQTSRVVEKYKNFLKHFPNFKALANTSQAAVLKEWKGLGYNRRALSLHKLAKIITHQYRGRLSQDSEVLKTLPGIGKATAGSIAAFAFDQPTIFIETNIRRVFLDEFFSKKKNVSDKDIEKLVERTLDTKNPRQWYFALMDYGAYLSRIKENPNRRSRHYIRQSPFEGSNRQIRGKILDTLLFSSFSRAKLAKLFQSENKERLDTIISQLAKEGFIEERKNMLSLKN